jgi:hypothetical protein
MTMMSFYYDEHSNIRDSAMEGWTQHQMTLYCVVIVAGEQTPILRLSVHPVKSIIV